MYDVGGKVRKVLLVDYDPQFNLSQAFLPPRTYFQLEANRRTTLAILQDDETDIDPYHLQVPGNLDPPKVATLTHTVYKHADGSKLDIIPSTLDLMYIALGQNATRTGPFEERFRKLIDACRRKYDVVIIDCHPAGSIMTKTSLSNSDHIIIPVLPEPYAVRGVGLMLEFIGANRRGAKEAQPMILFNRVPRSGRPSEELEIRRDPQFQGMCLQNTLKQYAAFAEPMGGKGFVWESKKPWSTRAFQNALNVTTEIEARIAGGQSQ